jgi:hypothetical protein
VSHGDLRNSVQEGLLRRHSYATRQLFR